MKLNRPFASLIFAATFCARAQTAPASVILISIDTLRADHVGAYGYTKVRTPHIDSFAEGGTIFTQANCQVPLTLPSHTTLFTSTYPFENRIEENAERVPASAVTLASVLRSHGYKTAAFIGSVFLERQMGLDGGFDFYDSPFNVTTLSPGTGSTLTGPISAGRERRDGALVLRAARQWLTENNSAKTGQPVFAFVHLYDMHKPYPVSYDEQLKYVDRLMGSFQQSLQQLGLWDKSLVVLLADHGEGLGDHGEDSHGYFVYESTLHVPLLFHWPAGTAHPAPRINDPAGLIDVAPTVLDYLHLPIPPSFEGKTLLTPGAMGEGGTVYSESLHARDAFGWAALRTVQAGGYKYIDAPRPELYNLRTDPHELKNLYVRGSAKANELREQLASLMARYRPKQPASGHEITSDTRALLDSLGYLAPGPRTPAAGPEPDPKDRLAEFRLYEEAWLEIYYRKLDQGIADLLRLLSRDPDNMLARRDLGDAYAQKKDYGKARAAYRAVLGSAPGDYLAQYETGVADEKLGLLKEAGEHLEAACSIEPDSRESRQELDAVLRKIR